MTTELPPPGWEFEYWTQGFSMSEGPFGSRSEAIAAGVEWASTRVLGSETYSFTISETFVKVPEEDLRFVLDHDGNRIVRGSTLRHVDDNSPGGFDRWSVSEVHPLDGSVSVATWARRLKACDFRVVD